MKKLNSKPIVLTGMMGSGKTSVGKILAKKLNRQFIDSDEEICNASGQSIEEIFDEFGEDYFRAGEEKIVKRIMRENTEIILSSGGGTFINCDLREIINRNGTSIWLDANYKTLHKRLVRNKKSRPLFKEQNFKETLKQLINDRKTFYNLSHIRIDVNNLNILDIVENIIKELNFANENL